jgi:type I site-specific restriction-modification system R (restriction) subunit
MGERTLTDEDIKAMFSLSEKQLAKLIEQSEKTDRQIAETAKQMAETDKKIAKIHKELGGIGENNGLVAEEIVFHSLAKNKIFAGITFDFVDHGLVRSRKLLDGKNVTGEYDVLLYNGTSVAIIEVKHRVGQEALKRLIEVQLPRFRQIFPEHKDCKMYLGLGGMSFEKDIAEEARSLGIATLTLSGNAVEINDKDVKAW